MTNKELSELLAIHDDDAEIVIEVGTLRNDESWFTVATVTSAVTRADDGEVGDAVILTLAYR